MEPQPTRTRPVTGRCPASSGRTKLRASASCIRRRWTSPYGVHCRSELRRATPSDGEYRSALPLSSRPQVRVLLGARPCCHSSGGSRETAGRSSEASACPPPPRRAGTTWSSSHTETRAAQAGHRHRLLIPDQSPHPGRAHRGDPRHARRRRHRRADRTRMGRRDRHRGITGRASPAAPSTTTTTVCRLS
jgi:hypothetical protein